MVFIRSRLIVPNLIISGLDSAISEIVFFCSWGFDSKVNCPLTTCLEVTDTGFGLGKFWSEINCLKVCFAPAFCFLVLLFDI